MREWGNRRFRRRGRGRRFYFLGCRRCGLETQRLKAQFSGRMFAVCLKAYPDTNQAWFPSLTTVVKMWLAAHAGQPRRLSPHGSFPLGFSASLSFLLLSQEDVCGYEEGEDYGDYAVHGEEGGVQAGEIVRLDQRMFVEQEQEDGCHADDGEFAQREGWEQGDQKKEHDEVKSARDP